MAKTTLTHSELVKQVASALELTDSESLLRVANDVSPDLKVTSLGDSLYEVEQVEEDSE